MYKDTEEDDEDFEFYNESMFDPSQEVFSLFTQADNASKNLHVSDGMLKYLGLNNFFDKTKNTNTPLRRPSDRIAIEKVFKVLSKIRTIARGVIHCGICHSCGRKCR